MQSSLIEFFSSKIDKIQDWESVQLDLRSNTPLGKSYEKPNIASKFYAKGAIPSEDILIQDLKEMLSIYDDVIKLWPEFKELNDETDMRDSDISKFFKNEFYFSIEDFEIELKKSGLIYSEELITRYTASLATKPFVLLGGLSGSGKTKLAQSFAQWICADDSQYKIVPVGADWINREPLLGYVNALDNEEYILPENGALQLLIEANKDGNENKPYFLILDEMNLSHVERYFADFLSVMESKESFKLHSSENPLKSQSGIVVEKEYPWPKNLFVVGTVNIDETTYMFSPKVLDRANVIEFRVGDEDIEKFLENAKEVTNLNGEGQSMAGSFLDITNNNNSIKSENLNKTLVDFFKELQNIGAEFGYRTALEIQTLFLKLERVNPEYSDKDKENEKIDIAIMQKLLPKLHGSRRKLCPVLKILSQKCLEINQENIFDERGEYKVEDSNSIKYPLSFGKIARMYKNAIENGFASYAEA